MWWLCSASAVWRSGAQDVFTVFSEGAAVVPNSRKLDVNTKAHAKQGQIDQRQELRDVLFQGGSAIKLKRLRDPRMRRFGSERYTRMMDATSHAGSLVAGDDKITQGQLGGHKGACC
jgi:hypothetical protein